MSAKNFATMISSKRVCLSGESSVTPRGLVWSGPSLDSIDNYGSQRYENASSRSRNGCKDQEHSRVAGRDEVVITVLTGTRKVSRRKTKLVGNWRLERASSRKQPGAAS